jgi:predicted enzyme related to lactoylglutathione lyase
VGIRWLTASIDRPAQDLEAAVQFWTAATGSSLSAPRGDHGQFATLLPPDGDAYLRVQRVEHGGGSHLDVHVDDVDAFVRRAVTAGADVHRWPTGLVVLQSPAGVACCVVEHRGESVRPRPQTLAGAALHLVDQLCLDIPVASFDDECQFWSQVTGWDMHSSTIRAEFRFLTRPAWVPLRLLLQRREDNDGLARAHLDIASSDVAGLVAQHEALGANLSKRFQRWTVMSDPSSFPYCITSRDPQTGLLPLFE